MSGASKRDASMPVMWVVRGLVMLGLALGALTLFAIGTTILAVKEQRQSADLVGDRLDEAIRLLQTGTSRVRYELSSLLDGTSPHGDAPRLAVEDLGDGLDRVRRELRDWRAAEAIAGLNPAIDALKSTSVACALWRRRFLEHAEATRAEAADRKARSLLDAIRLQLASIEGQDRLDRAILLRDYLRSAPDDAERIACELAERELSLHLAEPIEARDDLADLAILVERLAADDRLDNLANLKDNLLWPTIARLQQTLLRIDRARGLDTNARALQELCVVLFGANYTAGVQDQTIRPGIGGLYLARRNGLGLTRDRAELAAAADAGVAGLHAHSAEVADAIHRDLESITIGVEAKLQESWRRALWLVGVSTMLFVILGSWLSRDVSKRLLQLRASREAALEASRSKSRFLANMSHEIRTPMNGVLGLAELLRDTALDPEQREMLDTIRGSGEALLHILNDVLDFSRIEADRIHLEAIPVDLGDLARDVERLYGPNARQKGVRFDCERVAGCPRRVVGDPSRLRQVLFNLVGNAIKFTTRGRVALRISGDEDTKGSAAVRFEVRDSGIGIAREAQLRLFQPFMQSDVSTTRRFGGSGLGLAISKRLVELMGGTLEVESTVGEGSVFSFVLNLPVCDDIEAVAGGDGAEPLVAARLHGDALAGTAARPRVLLVEDVAINQMVAIRLLERLGVEVALATDGAEAVAMTAAAAFDLVLMDCHMEGMDGDEATRRIRQREARTGQPRLKIVALTASVLDVERKACIDSGMDDVLSKPIDGARLREALARHVPAWAPADEAVPADS